MDGDDIEAIEVDLLIEAIYRGYGFDFRGYAQSSLRRRIAQCLTNEGVPDVSTLQGNVLRDKECLERLLPFLSVGVTSMFRDAPFYRAMRSLVVPLLKTYPFVRVWLAGCASGEEVYSFAILLMENGLYDKSLIYATDMSEQLLHTARTGIYSLAKMKQYSVNYQESGGTNSLSRYYDAQYDRAIFRSELKKNVVFAQHNLATDESFNEFNLVICRNVMIYFDAALQERTFQLLNQSLCRLGILGLGDKESLRSSGMEDQYETLDGKNRIFRRIK